MWFAPTRADLSGSPAAVVSAQSCPAQATNQPPEVNPTRGVAMRTSEVLNRAADLIEERGWTKGTGWLTASREASGNTSLCLEGGIMAALGMRIDIDASEELLPLWTCPAYRAVADHLDRDVTIEDGGRFPRPVEALYWWNDENARSAEHVIEVLRATALIEAARERADVHEVVGASS